MVRVHQLTGLRTTSAARWFEILAEKVNPIVDKRRRAGDRAVKVAVIDTGIDTTHERVRYHLERHGSKIIDCQDWSASPHGADDHVGHGTAVCDVLLRTAKVHLYVGKVSDEATFDEKVPGRIAEVRTLQLPCGDRLITLTRAILGRLPCSSS
jgi:hypothetical protein